jgi:hypothetical protein
MVLRLRKVIPPPKVVDPKIEEIMATEGKFLTETQLAEILGLSVKQAVIKAVLLKFSRIRVKGSRYYSKKQVRAYLNK